MRCHIRHINYFSTESGETDAAIARLCILREDYYLESIGVSLIRLLDFKKAGLDDDFCKIYFFRNLLKTLSEVRRATCCGIACKRLRI